MWLPSEKRSFFASEGRTVVESRINAQAGCARLPYTTAVVHQDQRVSVMLQREVTPAGYSHPVEIAPQYIAAILRGFSLREQQRLPPQVLPKKLRPIRSFAKMN